MLAFCFFVSISRNAIRRKIYKAIYDLCKGHKVLALELCPDKSITVGAMNFLKRRDARYEVLDSISDAQKNKYDVVIISNALSDRHNLHKNLQTVNKYLAEDGVVIAPACISKKKRKKNRLHKFGVAQYFIQPLTKEEYIDQVSEKGLAVQSSYAIYDPTRIMFVVLKRLK